MPNGRFHERMSPYPIITSAVVQMRYVRIFRYQKQSAHNVLTLVQKLIVASKSASRPCFYMDSNASWILPTLYLVTCLIFPFRYQTGSELKVFPYWGKLSMYEAGGYKADLSSLVIKSVEIVQQLKNTRWVDHLTRAVLLEVNVYNANSNLFSVIMVSFEFPPSGGAFPRYAVDTVSLYRYNATMGVIALLAEICCLIMFIVNLVGLIIRLMEQRCTFFLRLANWADMTILVSYVISLSFYIYRSVWTVLTVEEMINNPGGLPIICPRVICDICTPYPCLSPESSCIKMNKQ